MRSRDQSVNPAAQALRDSLSDLNRMLLDSRYGELSSDYRRTLNAVARDMEAGADEIDRLVRERSNLLGETS